MAVRARWPLSRPANTPHTASRIVNAQLTLSGGSDLIVPAGINDTSTITGKVVALRAISGTITGASTVTAKVVRLRPISGTVTGTSTLAGGVVRVRLIQPAAIAGTSTVTASLVRLRAISGGAVAAHSSLSGSITGGTQAQTQKSAQEIFLHFIAPYH